jgi:hypothetical protein
VPLVFVGDDFAPTSDVLQLTVRYLLMLAKSLTTYCTTVHTWPRVCMTTTGTVPVCKSKSLVKVSGTRKKVGETFKKESTVVREKQGGEMKRVVPLILVRDDFRCSSTRGPVSFIVEIAKRFGHGGVAYNLRWYSVPGVGIVCLPQYVRQTKRSICRTFHYIIVFLDI